MLSRSSSIGSSVRAPWLCLAIGCLVGTLLGGWDAFSAEQRARILAALCELALLAWLFGLGLSMRALCELRTAITAVRLCAMTMLAAVLLVGAGASVILGLDAPHAVLLAGVLAPSEAALSRVASASRPRETEAAQAALRAQAALSGALALPLTLLALALTGHDDAGPLVWRWLARDVLWATASGAALGTALGTLGARIVRDLSSSGRPGLAEALLACCIVALAYGGAVLIGANGLLAVLTAGYALACTGERRLARLFPEIRRRNALAVLGARLQYVANLTAVLLLGVVASTRSWHVSLLIFGLVVVLALRPIARRIAVVQLKLARLMHELSVGCSVPACLYGLTYALGDGVAPATAETLSAAVSAVLVTSVLLAGFAVSPLPRAIDQRV